MNPAEVRKMNSILDKEKSDDGTAYRVLRGGSWDGNFSAALLSSVRNYNHPSYRIDRGGFRLGLEVGSGG